MDLPSIYLRRGFSLLEMSIVVVIISLIAVMGLEATSIYLGRAAYTTTRDKIAVIDQALRDYYRVTGRLPCPANRTLAENYATGTTFGQEDCTTPVTITNGAVNMIGIKAGGSGYSNGSFTFDNTGIFGSGATATYTVTAGAITAATVTAGGSGYNKQPTVSAPGGSGATLYAGTTSVYFGWVPVGDLNLPISAGLDAYGARINYVVTQGLTNAYTFRDTKANIEMRSGLLKQPCTGTCEVLADPTTTPPSGAAYVVFSHGADQRGAIGRNGAALQSCVPSTSYDLRIDSQNCALITGMTLDTASIGGTIPNNVFYDSRFNNGAGVEANYFDDIVLWRSKGQL